MSRRMPSALREVLGKMANMEKINVGDMRFQGLLERYLRLRASDGTSMSTNLHLDEDTLAAFIDGNLSMRETTPVVAHLSDCSFCRHKTTEFVRLDLAIAGADTPPDTSVQREPSRISSVLDGTIQRLFDTDRATVFAHEEKSNDEESNSSDSEKE